MPSGAGLWSTAVGGAARGPRPRASGQEAVELPDEDEVLVELPDVVLAPDAAEEEAGFEAAGAVEDFPPERESVR
ncbi:hypothetical protein [Cellulosimicrobium sp. E-16]|uniref:hypothetical protein n=1 Tax=Cellulosimicrobium sp. E-16 TaxID=3404049 RepID=UPI003CF22BA3